MSVKNFSNSGPSTFQLAGITRWRTGSTRWKAPYLRLPDQPRFAVPDVGRRACGRQDRGSRHILFGDFGKLDGQISDITARGFLLELAMTQPNARSCRASSPGWKRNRKSWHPRRQEARPHHPGKSAFDADLRRRQHPRCFIIDMSMSGASVSSDVQPQIGMPLAVGACVGRVVRLLPTASPSSSSSARTATILNGASSDLRRFLQPAQRLHLGPQNKVGVVPARLNANSVGRQPVARRAFPRPLLHSSRASGQQLFLDFVDRHLHEILVQLPSKRLSNRD